MSSDLHHASGHLQKVFKSRQTILSLLNSQGFNVEDYSDFTINEVNTLVQNKQLDMLVENEGKQTKTYIKYHLSKSIRPNNITEYVDDLFDLEAVLTKNDTLIIIVKDEPNDTMIQHIKQLWQTNNYYVSIYYIARLQFNILEHTKVPKHIKMNEEEKLDMYQKFNVVNDLQIPEISRFDPVALAISLRPGELCKIIRPSKTAILSEYYRICIN